MLDEYCVVYNRRVFFKVNRTFTWLWKQVFSCSCQIFLQLKIKMENQATSTKIKGHDESCFSSTCAFGNVIFCVQVLLIWQFTNVLCLRELPKRTAAFLALGPLCKISWVACIMRWLRDFCVTIWICTESKNKFPERSFFLCPFCQFYHSCFEKTKHEEDCLGQN